MLELEDKNTIKIELPNHLSAEYIVEVMHARPVTPISEPTMTTGGSEQFIINWRGTVYVDADTKS